MILVPWFIFYILPFIIAVALPAFVVPLVVKKIVNKHKKELPSLVPFSAILCGLAILANFIWGLLIFNVLYYEWDSTFLKYTFLFHESPLLDGSGSWLAHGWSQTALDAVWLMLTIGVYAVGAVIVMIREAKKDNQQTRSLFRKVIIWSVAGLTAMSIGLPLLLIWGFSALAPVLSSVFHENLPPEVIAPCKVTPVTQQPSHPVVFSQQDAYETFRGTALMAPYHIAVSPDGSTIALSYKHRVWVKCLNSSGSYGISLPKYRESNDGFYGWQSKLSWSPDSKYVVMNFDGDIDVIDVAQQHIQTLKSQVGLRNNHVDLAAKEDQGKTAYTVGDVLWSSTNVIYYTAFDQNLTKVHAYDFSTKTDTVLYSTPNLMYLDELDSSGQQLKVIEYQSEETFTQTKNSYWVNLKKGWQKLSS